MSPRAPPRKALASSPNQPRKKRSAAGASAPPRVRRLSVIHNVTTRDCRPSGGVPQHLKPCGYSGHHPRVHVLVVLVERGRERVPTAAFGHEVEIRVLLGVPRGLERGQTRIADGARRQAFVLVGAV